MADKNSVLRDKNYLEITYKDSNNKKGDYPDVLAKHLLKNYYKKPGKILDIGCGNGDFLKAFSRLGFEVVGVDISPDIKQRLGDRFEVMSVDIENASNLFEGEFDFVFSKSVIEHLREPSSMLKMAKNALKPGGKAIVMCPSWEHTYWGPYYIDHTHVTAFTRPSLEQALKLCGFSSVTADYFYQLPFTWKHNFYKVVPKIISKLPIPYAPWNRVPWKTNLYANKLVRFSKEVMLISVAVKDD